MPERDDMPVTQAELIESLNARGYWPTAGHTAKRPGWSNFSFDQKKKDSEQALREAILLLQRTYGLEETGVANAELIAFLSQPHCAVPDRPGPAGLRSGGVPWASPKVTYQWMSFLPDIDQAAQVGAFERAFATWSTVCSVRFTRVEQKGDMRIVCGAGAHGDLFPFDGLGKELAHAFYPDWPDKLRGDVHVDAAENWSTDDEIQSGFFDLESVVLHEIGHSIGLAHSAVPGSVMFPNYSGMVRSLGAMDVATIKALYPG